MDDVKLLDGLTIDDYNTLTIVGATTLGEAFMGTQDIKIIDVVPHLKIRGTPEEYLFENSSIYFADTDG
jgi:hypothetical protein